MTTRNIAPRENGEGSIGTQIKRWLKGWFNTLDVSGNMDVGGNVTATGDVSVGGNLSVTGTATGVTPAATDNSTKLATTAFVKGFQRAEGWNASTSYAVGNTVRASTLPSQYLLSCATAGTSSDTEPDCTGASIGDTIYDNSIEWLVMAYLPVTGGTMQGDIALANNSQIKNTVDNGLVRIQGGRDENMGARLVLSGKSRSTNPGAFECVANNGTTSKTLVGKTDGTLVWDGKTIATTNNTVNLTGNQTVAGIKTFSSSPIAPTPASTDYSTKVATTAFVKEYSAPKASPTFTGTPTAPTPATTDNSTKVATTEYVKDSISHIGNYESDDSTSAYTAEGGVAETAHQIELYKGTWLVTGHLRFTSVQSGHSFGIQLSQSSSSFNTTENTAVMVHSSRNSAISLQTMGIFVCSADAQMIYLNLYTTLDLASYSYARIRAVRIK